MLLGVILVAITLAGCGLFVLRPAWFPIAISSEALVFDRQFSQTLWIAGIIFICAHLLLAWALLRRRRTGPVAPGTQRVLEIGWTLAASAIFLGLAVAGSRGWAKVPHLSPREEVIEVYARQFHWSFRYPGADGVFGHTDNRFISDSGGNPMGIDPADAAGKDDIVPDSLRIPAGRDVLLLLHSRDVIHDFFVRELRTKQDIVPGMEIPLEIHVDRVGRYEIACAELCGLGHSQMASVMIVMPPADFDQWKRNSTSTPSGN
ncbi:MAG: cytochrome C oxidase subunit II [Terriglobia bacterium]